MDNPQIITGLTSEAVLKSRAASGSNSSIAKQRSTVWVLLKEMVLEPMFILLIAACIIYFIAGQYAEGFVMVTAIIIVSGISFFQEYRSRNAIDALRKLSASETTVIRNGIKQKIPVDQIVLQDVVLLEEGEIIAADGRLLIANDFSVNESNLTGESLPVFKSVDENANVYKGTLVTSGSATIVVTAIGSQTTFDKIGLSLQSISVIKTPLQKQIQSFVKNMAIVGGVAFCIVVAYNYFYSRQLFTAFMQGLTLAMSILPEEIPVAFTTFMALGAMRMMKNGVLVKQPQYVETLGAATVICTDKTGTLTLNEMKIAWLYDVVTGQSISAKEKQAIPHLLLEYAMWASETTAFDPMEKAIHEMYGLISVTDKRKEFLQVHEYPLGGTPPFMTHIFRNAGGETIIAAKGAPEALIALSTLSTEKKFAIKQQVLQYAASGFRVLAVGRAVWNEPKFPVAQTEFAFDVLGLLAFSDPPKKNMAETISTFHAAGIKVKMITGDYPETAMHIAQELGIAVNSTVLTGNEVVQMPAEELKTVIGNVQVFARMYPEAKLKIIEALRENGEVVAMTGDGVNDAPALKAADIGIAMGKRGSEVARDAASLVLTDDDLAHMTDAVLYGRKIYDNLEKAIRYIISIHVPIILIVVVPLLLNWNFYTLFFPVHVIFLEIVMGPTCSIVYENEPAEPGVMQRSPRKMSSTFLSLSALLVSILQGLIIAAGCLGIAAWYLHNGYDNTLVRTMVFITIIFCNIFLSFVNRSFRYNIFISSKKVNPLLLYAALFTLLSVICFITIPFFRGLFQLTAIGFRDILYSITVAAVSTFWIELFKGKKQR